MSVSTSASASPSIDEQQPLADAQQAPPSLAGPRRVTLILVRPCSVLPPLNGTPVSGHSLVVPAPLLPPRPPTDRRYNKTFTSCPSVITNPGRLSVRSASEVGHLVTLPCHLCRGCADLSAYSVPHTKT